MGGLHYLPLTDEQRQQMLAAMGIASTEELFDDIPAAVRPGEMSCLLPFRASAAAPGDYGGENKN